jgi:hypothetical protein
MKQHSINWRTEPTPEKLKKPDEPSDPNFFIAVGTFG